MYEEFVGKRVQITMLKDGNEDIWPPKKLTKIDGSLLYFDESGEVVDTESEDFVSLRPEPSENL